MDNKQPRRDVEIRMSLWQGVDHKSRKSAPEKVSSATLPHFAKSVFPYQNLIFVILGDIFSTFFVKK